MWRIIAIIKLLINPKKLWYIPELVFELQCLEDHERGLHQEHLSGYSCEICKIKPNFHLWSAEELQDILGPFGILKHNMTVLTDEEIKSLNKEFESKTSE